MVTTVISHFIDEETGFKEVTVTQLVADSLRFELRVYLKPVLKEHPCLYTEEYSIKAPVSNM